MSVMGSGSVGWAPRAALATCESRVGAAPGLLLRWCAAGGREAALLGAGREGTVPAGLRCSDDGSAAPVLEPGLACVGAVTGDCASGSCPGVTGKVRSVKPEVGTVTAPPARRLTME